METKTKDRGRHRLGGKHSDPITVPNNKKPRGAHAAKPATTPTTTSIRKPRHSTGAVLIPPKPEHAPTIGVPKFNATDMHEVLKPSTTQIKVVRHKSKITALTALATGGLLIVGGSAAGNATSNAVESKSNSRTDASDLERESLVTDPITVPLDVLISQPKVNVKTEAASAQVPVATPETVKPVAGTPVIPESTVNPVAPSTPAITVKPAPPKTARVAPVQSAKAGIIASAALAQVGRMQDCTMLVTNALAVAGIQYHGWPAGYYSLGHAVSAGEAVPGDLVYYANGGAGVAHIAVYIGNGQAVHGGWNGNQTVVSSVNVGSGPAFIRVTV